MLQLETIKMLETEMSTPSWNIRTACKNIFVQRMAIMQGVPYPLVNISWFTTAQNSAFI